jgi:signal transduction histidine kinase
MFHWWRNLSVAKKLYSVVGLMAILIATELFTLLFAMRTLSSVRAFVAGEGLWTKAQKNAFQSLYQYALSGDEKFYLAFNSDLKITEGDHLARLALMKNPVDHEAARQGFLDGGNHPGDVEGMINLLVRFNKISFIHDAIVAWSKADGLLSDLKQEARRMRRSIRKVGPDSQQVRALLADVANTNRDLTALEIDFSSALGAGSRWLERLLMTILVITVFSVESTGVFLTIRFSRSLRKSLKEIKAAAEAVEKGDFSVCAPVTSEDELGQLAEVINKMTEALDAKVKIRTQELAEALNVREEFLSIASHELKTPLTSLKLELQLAKRHINNLNPQKMAELLDSCLNQTDVLNEFITDLLDDSRIRGSQLSLSRQPIDLSATVAGVVDRLSQQLANANIQTELQLENNLIGRWDGHRIEQVIANLVSNAIKYAPHAFLRVQTKKLKDRAQIVVQDTGAGIQLDKPDQIFQRFTRGKNKNNIGGLGLGLYIVKRIVEAHNGSISVRSKPEEGAEFLIELPT